MPKPKLYAAVICFDRPRPDGSVGVAIFDRPHGWQPTKKQHAQIDSLCDQACDWIDDGDLEPGRTAWVFSSPPSKTIDIEKYVRGHEAFLDPASNKFCVGLFLIDAHPQHETVQ